MWTKETIHELVEKQRTFFRTNQTLDIDWRIHQLKRLKTMPQMMHTLISRAMVAKLPGVM